MPSLSSKSYKRSPKLTPLQVQAIMNYIIYLNAAAVSRLFSEWCALCMDWMRNLIMLFLYQSVINAQLFFHHSVIIAQLFLYQSVIIAQLLHHSF